MYRKLTTVAAVAALAFGLAACGGGGSSPTTDNQDQDQQDDMMPPAPTPVAVTVPDAMYLDEDNAPMAGPPMMIAAGGTETSGGVTFLCAAGGEACVVTVADDGSVSATGGTVTASLTAAAMTQVAAAKEMKSDEMLAMRDRIIGKDAAIEGATNLATGDATTETPSVLQESEISITRAAGKPARVRVSSTGPDGYGVADTPAMANGSWAGTHLTRSLASSTQHLFVYTDIEAPTRVQFYNFDGKGTTPDRYGGSVDTGGTVITTDDVSTAVPYTTTTTIPPLALTTATPLFSGAVLDPTKFNAPGPEGGGNTSQRFIGSPTGALDTAGAPTPGVRFKGNYNGAAGTYNCVSPTTTGATAGDCVVVIPETGPYTSTGTWTFTPELGATAWRNDPEFMSFGWWLQEPNSANGTYTFQYYADGTAYAGTPIAPSGTATYTGRAAGKYAVQTLEDGGVTGGIVGQFTAAASLTVNFDAVTNAGVSAPTIQGTINGFQGEHPEVAGWEVTLHRNSITPDATNGLGIADIAAQTQLDPARPSYDGVTATMGDQTAYGDWTAQFFGNAKTPSPTGTPTNTDGAQPLGVGGTFQADNDVASIAGAFGARR